MSDVDPLTRRSAAERLSRPQARRIALGAQGFTRARPRAVVGPRHLTALIDRIGILQIDSVNVLSRSHYLPVFARLGSYDRTVLDRASARAPRRLVEYWAHEASLVAPSTHRLLRFRMAQAREKAWGGMRRAAEETPTLLTDVIALVAAQGPLTAVQIERAVQTTARGERGGWWNWSTTKRAVEYLFWAGELTSAGRTPQFERLYDLPERVLPLDVHAQSDPDPATAHRELMAIAARAHGIGTLACLRDYFRLETAPARQALVELVDEARLVPVRVEGLARWHYLDPAAVWPRRVRARALLSPFDSLIWERRRALELFDYHFRIEIYTPQAQRVHGYYVLSFLWGETIAARVDLKADRRADGGGVLRVQAAWAEPGAPVDTVQALAAELGDMAEWLGMNGVVVAPIGTLAGDLAAFFP